MKIKLFIEAHYIPQILELPGRFFLDHYKEELDGNIYHIGFRTIYNGMVGLKSYRATRTSIVLVGKEEYTLVHIQSIFKDEHITDFIHTLQENGIEYEVLDPGFYSKELELKQ